MQNAHDPIEHQNAFRVDEIISDSYIHPEFLSKEEADIIFNKIEKEVEFVPRQNVYYRGNLFSRDIQLFGQIEPDGTYPLYRFPGIYDTIKPLPFPDFLQELTIKIFKITGQNCNHLVLNRYVNGDDKIVPHHDKTNDWYPNAGVVTVSLGFKRHLVISENNGEELRRIKLRSGSLYFLGPVTNAALKHSIPPENIAGVRYALTFRSIKTKKKLDGTIIE